MSDGAWTDALLAAALFAVDPGTGGVSLRARPGPLRDRFLSVLRDALPPGAPVRQLPTHIADDRLLGGLDLPATLRAGRPVAAAGLLAEAHGGIVVLAMAERVSASVVGRLSVSLDTGEVATERDGVALRNAAAIGVVALDEGMADDERPAAALLDRLAFLVDLGGIGLSDMGPAKHDRGHVRAGRALLPSVTVPDEILQALCGVAEALGVASMRALLLAVRAARAAAALGGRTLVAEADAMTAARLVLAPRATVLPEQPPGPPPDPPEQEEPRPSDGSTDPRQGDERDEDAAGQDERNLGEIVLAAAKAAMPAGLLAELRTGNRSGVRVGSAGRSGAPRHAKRRGRPIGVRQGELRAGARLHLVETLRAAAPWQRLRGGMLPDGAGSNLPRIVVLRDDFRIRRFRQRTESTTIFLVDASGSAALNRLAEAKGAVELVLGDCYARRDRVALVAFRGTKAELLLPPTTSLARAKRCLAGLPGGGGTPLATGIDAAFALADAVRRKGQDPILVVLSDGRANIARDLTPGRARAEADALAAGRRLRGAGIACVLVDTSPRPAPQAKRLAGEMGAMYLPLPYANAEALSRAVRANAHG